jgi:hypothetical protein
MTTLRPHVKLCVAVIVFVCLAPSVAAEEETILLTFALPEGKVLNYKASRLDEMVSYGMEVTVSHSMMVEVSLNAVMEDGLSKISLSFGDEDASLLRDGELEDYDPEIKLEGKTIYAFVDSKGEVSKAEAASNIPGLSAADELRELVEDWFVRLPGEKVTVGQEWRIDFEKMGMSQEGEEPEVKGYTDFKLKKVQEKNGIMIAEIEGKTRMKINKTMYQGTLVAEGKGEVKTKIAIDGGYVIECKRKMDVKGKTVGKDPITGKESESKTAITQYFECKLKK